MCPLHRFSVSCRVSRPRGAIGIFHHNSLTVEALDAVAAENKFRDQFECNREVTVIAQEPNPYKQANFNLMTQALKFAADYERAGFDVIPPTRDGDSVVVKYRYKGAK